MEEQEPLISEIISEIPPLWKACASQDIEEARRLLPSTARDDPGPDGTTAFALSLAQLNAELALAILDSGIEPRQDILACANEFVNLQLFKLEEKSLQNTMRSKLGGYFEPTSDAVVPPHYDCYIDERLTRQCNYKLDNRLRVFDFRYMATCQKYPFINTETEFKKYPVNSVMKKRLLGLGRWSKYLPFKDIKDPFILDNFCIYSTNGKWKISEDVYFNSTTCSHVQEVRREEIFMFILLRQFY